MTQATILGLNLKIRSLYVWCTIEHHHDSHFNHTRLGTRWLKIGNERSIIGSHGGGPEPFSWQDEIKCRWNWFQLIHEHRVLEPYNVQRHHYSRSMRIQIGIHTSRSDDRDWMLIHSSCAIEHPYNRIQIFPKSGKLNSTEFSAAGGIVF